MMEEKEQFKTVALNSDDYKGIEKAAKYTRETGKYLGIAALMAGSSLLQSKLRAHQDSTPKIDK